VDVVGLDIDWVCVCAWGVGPLNDANGEENGDVKDEDEVDEDEPDADELDVAHTLDGALVALMVG